MYTKEYFNKGRRRDSENIFDNAYNKRNIHHISEFWAFVSLVVILVLGLLSKYNLHKNLPEVLPVSGLIEKGSAFITERAWKDLKILNTFGSRPTGTYNNEILAVDFFIREISYIKKMANNNQLLDLDLQIVSGAYWTGKQPLGMTSVYNNVQNIVVKLFGQPHSGNTSSLLLNCHFDSVPGSPGASDDAANCVVMLEILRVLSRQKKRLQHGIIFLFNGAEETGLQASHGFITQHKWASEIKAFVNLESMGSGGKELLFQSSPNAPYLVKLYGEVAPYPSGQVVAEELFHTGLIPSDTDFRIFSDYGNIPGLDFAHTINSYRYHTKYDNIDYLSKNVIQHTGDNILELAKTIANCQDLGNVFSSDDQNSAKLVFFDIFGLVFITYSVDTAFFLNYGLITGSVLLPYLMLSKATKGVNKSYLRYEIFLGCVINPISLVISALLSFAVACDLDLIGKSMTWYSNTFMCIPTYCLITVFIQCTSHSILNHKKKSPLSLGLQAQARLIGTSLFWGILACVLTSFRIRATYIIIIPLIISLMTFIFIGMFNLQNSSRSWMYAHLIGQTLNVFWTTNYFNMVIDVFIPTAGRSGGDKNPDVIISILCSVLTLFTVSYIAPLVILLRKCKHFLTTMIAVYIATRLYIIPYTNLGFPYSDESGMNPRVQRHFITHTIRTLFDKNGNIRYRDSGFWMLNMDRNAQKTIESLTMPEVPMPQDKNKLCENEIFCGLPAYNPRQLLPGGFWIPAPEPKIQNITNLHFLGYEIQSHLFQSLNFQLNGIYLSSLQLRLRETVSLKSWSLTAEVPPKTLYNNQSVYFVMISHGLEKSSLNFTLNLETNTEYNNQSLVDITLITYHFESEKEYTATFSNMLAKLPGWTYAVSALASLQTWTF